MLKINSSEIGKIKDLQNLIIQKDNMITYLNNQKQNYLGAYNMIYSENDSDECTIGLELGTSPYTSYYSRIGLDEYLSDPIKDTGLNGQVIKVLQNFKALVMFSGISYTNSSYSFDSIILEPFYDDVFNKKAVDVTTNDRGCTYNALKKIKTFEYEFKINQKIYGNSIYSAKFKGLLYMKLI